MFLATLNKKRKSFILPLGKKNDGGFLATPPAEKKKHEQTGGVRMMCEAFWRVAVRELGTLGGSAGSVRGKQASAR